MKKNGLFLISLLVLILSLGVLSCEVGLGAQVDTVAPTVEIVTPPPSSIIRDSFIIGGKWTDDGSINSVSVNLKRINDNYIEEHNYTGNVDGNNWYCKIEPVVRDENRTVVERKIYDGEFLATVALTDNGGHTTKMRQSFVIDNTAPVVLIVSPTTDPRTVVKEELYQYGRTIEFKGNVADNNGIAAVNFDFYDDENKTIKRPYSEYIEEISADKVQFKITHSKEDTVESEYAKIYDGDPNSGEIKERYYTLIAYDKAQKYPEDMSLVRSEDDKKGNYTSDFYFNSNSAISSLLNEHFIEDFYKVKTRVFNLPKIKKDLSKSATDQGTPTAEVLDDNKILEILNNKDIVSNLGGFKLNPNNNPSYRIYGKGQISDNNDIEDKINQVTNGIGSTISVEIQMGIDKKPIDIENKENPLKVFVVEAGLENVESNRIYFEKSTNSLKIDNGDKVMLTLDPKTAETNGNKLVTGKKYYLFVTGQDIGKAEIIPVPEKGGKGYGFSYVEGDTAATISIDTIKNGLKEGKPLYVKKGDTLKISGKVIASGAAKTVTINIDGNDAEFTGDFKTDEAKNFVVSGDTYTYTYKLDSLAEREEGEAVTIECNLQLKNLSGEVIKTDNDSKEVFYDGTIPQLTLSTLSSGQAVGTKGSDKFILSGSVSDFGSGVDKITYTFTKLPKIESEATITGDVVTNKSVWSKEIDFSAFGESKIELAISAFDKLGNENKITPFNFYFDKSNPEIQWNDCKTNVNDVLVLKGKISDSNNFNDDCLEITIAKGDTRIAVNPKAIVLGGITTNELTGDKERTWEYTLKPSTVTNDKYTNENAQIVDDGDYTISVGAKDVSGRTTPEAKRIERTIIIDTKAPEGKLGFISTSTGSFNDKAWYNSKLVDVKVFDITDNKGSGIEKITAKAESSEKVTTLILSDNGYYEGSVQLEKDGQTFINFELTDKAGNKNTGMKLDVNLDTQAPVLEVITESLPTLVNGNNNVSFVVKPSDDHTGIKNVIVKTICGKDVGSNNIEVTSSESGEYTVNIKQADFANIFGEETASGSVSLSIVDNAGNERIIPVFSMTIDRKNPEVAIGVIADADRETPELDVNEKIDISGTLKDDNALESATLMYSITSDKENAKSWKELSNINIDNFNWTVTVDTKAVGQDETLIFTDKTSYSFRVDAKDKAGNTQSSNVIDLYVNQDSDRPVITLTNVEFKGNAEQGFTALLKNETTVLGTVTDDDGVSSISWTTNDVDWKPLDNGSFSFDVSEGVSSIKFKVVDNGKNGSVNTKTWTSGDLNTPKLFDKGKKGETRKQLDKGALSLTADKTPPMFDAVTTEYFNGTNWNTWTSSIPLGKNNSRFRVSFKVIEANGIAEVKIHDSAALTANEQGIYSYEIDTTTGLEEGLNTISYSVKDNADFTTNGSVQITIDNTAPTITVSAPTDTEAALSGIVTAYGTKDDPSASLKYAITAVPNGIVDASDDHGKPTEPQEYKEIKDAHTSWFVNFNLFDNEVETTSQGNVNTKSVNKYIEELYSTEVGEAGGIAKFDKITYLALWLKAEDTVGNISKPTYTLIKVDPQGDRPTLKVVSPEGGSSVAGEIKFIGTALDTLGKNVGVQRIWAQINSGSNDPKFSVTDAIINDWISKKFDVKNMDTLKPYSERTTEDLSRYAILIKDKSAAEESKKLKGASWEFVINTEGEFNPNMDVIGSTNNVAVKFMAEDGDKKFSILNADSSMYVKVDPWKPSFDKNTLYVTIKNSTEVVKSIEYKSSSDLYITTKEGETAYIEGTINDNFRIASVSVTGDTPITNKVLNNNSEALGESTVTPGDDENIKANFEFKNGSTPEPGQAPKTTGTCKFSIPLKFTQNDGVAKIYVKLVASDGESEVEQEFNINYDSKVPVIAKTEKDGLNINKRVQQRNSFYTFGSKVTEATVEGINQSGFKYVAAYFVRSKTNALYNPMLKENNATSLDSMTNTVDDSGLYWFTENNITIDGANITLEATPNANIHVNGLVKYDGVIYQITAIDGNTITLDGTPKNQSVKTAYFANALVIDNEIQEMGDTSKTGADGKYLNKNGYFNSIFNDDGDGMVEVAKKDGASWNWDASISSVNIPDGSIEIHYVVFDKAGNIAAGSVTDAQVCNNAPRIAGVQLFTDYDGDGKFDGAAEKIDTFSIENNYANYCTSVGEDGTKHYNWDEVVKILGERNPLPMERTYGSPEAGCAKIKGKTKIIPEIVGGNGNIYYSYDLPGAFEGNIGKAGDNGFALITAPSTDTVAELQKGKEIVIQTGDFLRASNGATPEEKKGKALPFKFTFWDSTSGETVFSTSLHADLTMYFELLGMGNGVPTATLNDFYWNSKDDNSLVLADDGTPLGHIELSADWQKAPGYTSKETNDRIGIFDLDDKVSGQVKIQGTASDDYNVYEILVKIPKAGINEFVAVAKNNGNGWKYLANSAAKSVITGVKMGTATIDPETYKQTIPFTLIFNSEAIQNGADADVQVFVQVKNSGAPIKPITSGSGDYVTSIDGTTNYYGIEYSDKKEVSADSLNKQMDVVPYISSIKRGSQYVTERTKLGGFSLRRGEAGLQFTCFNDTVPSTTSKAKAVIDSRLTPNDGTYTIADAAYSGPLSVTVNGIEAINAINNNDAEYNKEKGDAFGGEIVTDDRYLHIWRISDQDRFQGSKGCQFPSMSKDPATGWLYSAFSNGGYGQIFVSSEFVGDSVDGIYQAKKKPKPNTNVIEYTKNMIEPIYGSPNVPGHLDIDVSTNINDKKIQVDVGYGATYRTSDNGEWDREDVNDHLTQTIMHEKYAGGIYIYNNRFLGPEIGSLNADSKYTAYRGQLYVYQKYLDQFKNVKVLHDGDFIHYVYYDEKNLSVNYSSIRANRDNEDVGNGTTRMGNVSDMENTGFPWVSIDGGLPPEYDTSSRGAYGYVPKGKGENDYKVNYNPARRNGFWYKHGNMDEASKDTFFGTPYELNRLNLANRSTKVGEYMGIAVTKHATGARNGTPIIVYSDVNNGILKIARSTSYSGTMDYMENEDGVIGDECGVLVKGKKKINDIDREGKWNIITATSEAEKLSFGEAGSYVDCAVSEDGKLHIVYRTKTGNLVYKVSKTAVDSSSAIEFEPAVQLDNCGTNINLNIEGNKPFISYIATPDAYNSLKVAFKMNGKWETMSAPSNVTIKDAKTSAEQNAKASDDKSYSAAVGVYTGNDYRAMFYTGEEEKPTTGK